MTLINVRNLCLQFDEGAYDGSPLEQARQMIQGINEALARVPDACPQLTAVVAETEVEIIPDDGDTSDNANPKVENTEEFQRFFRGVRGTAGSLWHRFGSEEARREGWDLFTRCDNEELEIELIAEPCEVPELAARGIVDPIFDADDAVVRHCLAKAREGSRVHQLALYLEGRIHDRKCWVPDELLQK